MRKNSGYPPIYWRSLRRFLMRYCAFLLVVFALVCCCAYNVIYFSASPWSAAWSGGFFAYLLLALYLTIASKPKLVLYFEARVPGSWVWSAPLARNCVFLDELCDSLGVAALSSFGFVDERSRETMDWHAPQNGLETVIALIQELRAQPDSIEESDAILADLQKMKNRLLEAQAHQVRFCFILHEGSINAMEIEQRRGHF